MIQVSTWRRLFIESGAIKPADAVTVEIDTRAEWLAARWPHGVLTIDDAGRRAASRPPARQFYSQGFAPRSHGDNR